ncbi:MAG: response regulator [Planctomycetes bacterium]|nr:response regulator [Planctomycetota bacterium]
MAWNILIVDDSSLTRKRIRRIIEMADLDIGEFLDAENGEEALKILEDSPVDLVLSDLNMPKMGGAEMVQRMKSREATKSIPVVVISTESKTSRLTKLLAEGVRDYLHKPFTPEEFKETMQTLWAKPETNTSNLLAQALVQSLETMALVTAVPVDDDMVVPEETVLAQIDFSGAKKGAIQMLAGMDLCGILAENIAALDTINDQAALDALKELSNVTCGLFLPLVVSSTADVFDITVPKVATCDNAPQWTEFVADGNTFVLNIEGHAIAARLTVEDAAMTTETN